MNNPARLTRFGYLIDVDDPLMQQRVQWAQDLLAQLDWPIGTNALISFVAWATAEGGGVGTENIANFNPLNTTEPYGGSCPINSVNVQSYPTYQDGLTATGITLAFGYYTDIVALLKAGAEPAEVAAAIGASPWGTPGYLVSECVAEAQAAVAQYFVPAPPPVPAPPVPPPVPKEAEAMFVRNPGPKAVGPVGAGGICLCSPAGAVNLGRSWPGITAAYKAAGVPLIVHDDAVLLGLFVGIAYHAYPAA